jgi:uncharacterized phiE125 gp8 family phage protein
MMLIEETGVSRDALPLAEFKAHLRLGTGFAEEGLQEPVLESFLRAAIAAIEARTGKVLIRRVFHWTQSEWRTTDGQPMPVAPVTAITSLTLHSRDGDHEAIGAEFYRLEADAHRPVLRAQGAMLPAIPRGGTAEIVFEAGFAESWGGLPADLGQAVLLLAAHYYEYRDETALGGGCMPFGVSSLIERYRTVRLFHGTAG